MQIVTSGKSVTHPACSPCIAAIWADGIAPPNAGLGDGEGDSWYPSAPATPNRGAGIKKRQGMFLCSAVSSPLDRSKHVTLHLLAHLFAAPTRLLWEAFRQAVVTAQRLITHIPTASIARYSFIQLSEMGRRGENENGQTSKR